MSYIKMINELGSVVRSQTIKSSKTDVSAVYCKTDKDFEYVVFLDKNGRKIGFGLLD